MTHIIRSALLAIIPSLVVLSSCSSFPEAPERNQNSLPTDAGTNSIIFKIDNESTRYIGPVTINGANDTIPLIIDSTRVYEDTLSFTPVSLTVHGVQCDVGDTTLISLSVGKIVVLPADPGLIAIIDYQATN